MHRNWIAGLEGAGAMLASALVLAVLAPLGALTGDASLLWVAPGALALAGAALWAAQGRGSAPVLAAALVGLTMLLTAALSGHALQAQAPLLLFVTLAVLALSGRSDLLLWAGGGLAVQHLLLSASLPDLVHPRDPGLAAAALNAALLALAAMALAWTMHRHAAKAARAEAAATRAETERAMAADALAEAEAAQARADAVITEMRLALSRLAGRDLSCSIATPFPPQYEVLRREFNMTTETLREAFGAATGLAEDFSGDALSLSSAMQAMSSHTEAQAEALSAVTATAAQLVAALGSTADHAKDAAASANEARDSALRGGDVTGEAIRAMRQIEDSSRQISQIVDLIDDVSFQTNLLALNAGVEAARAGTAGKGFAVVAAEVRQLAKSTSEAAAGIKTLIGDSSAQVQTGAELVDAVGQRLEEIKAQIARASDLTESISAKNVGQASALHQLHAMVREADEACQTASGEGDRLTAMTRRMTVASKKLACDMQAFTLSDAEIAAGTSAPGRAAAG